MPSNQKVSATLWSDGFNCTPVARLEVLDSCGYFVLPWEMIMSMAFDSTARAFHSSPPAFSNDRPAFDNVMLIRPAMRPIRTYNANDIEAQLYALGACDTAEMEFSLPSHLVMLLPDGISGGCEWNSCDKGGKLSVVARNTIFFSPAGEYLFFRKRKSQVQCRMLLIMIRPSIIARINDEGIDDLTGVQFNQQIGLDDQITCQTLIAIQQELECPGVSAGSYVDSLLMLVLNRLVRCASNLAVHPARSKYAKGGLANWRLRKALELLEGDSTGTPSLAEIAQSISLHPTSFCRAFKQSTGMSPHRYMLVHRVNRAKDMMRNPDLTLTQIALDCGFGGSSQFSAVFNRIVGIPPRTYRRSM